MNRQQAKELAPIVAAFGDGKTIQFRATGCGDKRWEDIPFGNWRFTVDTIEHNEYRLKPEPREVYLEIAIKNGEIIAWHHKHSIHHQNPISRFHLFREVLEDE